MFPSGISLNIIMNSVTSKKKKAPLGAGRMSAELASMASQRRVQVNSIISKYLKSRSELAIDENIYKDNEKTTLIDLGCGDASFLKYVMAGRALFTKVIGVDLGEDSAAEEVCSMGAYEIRRFRDAHKGFLEKGR